MQWDVIDLDNANVGTIDLPDGIFGAEVRADLMARYVKWQQAKRRAGTHKTKLRGEVARTPKKPFKQKGGGRARQGSLKGPQFRGGAVVFGPQPRDHAHDLPKQVRRRALASALSAKRAEGSLVVVENVELAEVKTKALATRLDRLGWKKPLVIDGESVQEGFRRAARNIVGLDVLPSQGANVYDILRHETLVLTRAAVAKLTERLS